jgi:hypothetical protein
MRLADSKKNAIDQTALTPIPSKVNSNILREKSH